MKVKIGPYKDWFGPYQLASALCFWAKKVPDEFGILREPDWVHKFGEWLEYGSIEPEPQPGDVYDLFSTDRKPTWLCRLLTWIDSKKKRTIKVRIDRYDTWSMDHTLAHIILPMLKQLKETKHGSPFVDPKDVPVELRPAKLTKKQKDVGETDNTHHERWDYVLDEMIFAFENLIDDSWKDQFRTGNSELKFKKLENGNSEMISNHSRYDWDGIRSYEKRIQNGFVLFGKYFQALWD